MRAPLNGGEGYYKNTGLLLLALETKLSGGGWPVCPRWQGAREVVAGNVALARGSVFGVLLVGACLSQRIAYQGKRVSEKWSVAWCRSGNGDRSH